MTPRFLTCNPAYGVAIQLLREYWKRTQKGEDCKFSFGHVEMLRMQLGLELRIDLVLKGAIWR